MTFDNLKMCLKANEANLIKIPKSTFLQFYFQIAKGFY